MEDENTNTENTSAEEIKPAVERPDQGTKKEAEQTMFAGILSRNNDKIRDDRAGRISEACSDAAIAVVQAKKKVVRGLCNEIDAMMDLSADNQNTSLNVISPDFDADEYVGKLTQLNIDLEIAKQELDVAQVTTKKYFG